jgi:signal transduction histidine kinase
MERFFRASNTRGAGSGLGLAIVREVAQLHDATVSIDAGPDGKGISIEMLFPPQITA